MILLVCTGYPMDSPDGNHYACRNWAGCISWPILATAGESWWWLHACGFWAASSCQLVSDLSLLRRHITYYSVCTPNGTNSDSIYLGNYLWLKHFQGLANGLLLWNKDRYNEIQWKNFTLSEFIGNGVLYLIKWNLKEKTSGKITNIFIA